MRDSPVSAQAPLISVVIPLYNGEKTLPQTVDSIRGQSLADFEIIVIDDGSTDGALDYLESVHDPRLHIFRYANGGLAAARNRGIERARGEFISFIDSDDLWTQDKLALQLQALRRNPEAALSYSWTVFIDEHGDFLFAKDPSSCREGDVYADLLRECFVASGSNILVRKDCAVAVGGFDTALNAAQDWEFCLRVAARWPFAVVPRYQILYRISEQAMSANADRCEEACLGISNRAFAARPRPLAERGESLANVKQYAAFLYLTRASGPEAWKEAGQKLAECIRLDPRSLLTWKLWHLLFAWSLGQFLPVQKRRPAMINLLRLYGRWSMLRQPELRRVVEELKTADHRRMQPTQAVQTQQS
jgi:glycosyltransferase involved in cell wall biosynthesis